MPVPNAVSSTRGAETALLHPLYPLDEACALSGVAPPSARTIDSSGIPDACRPLLQHDRDMTGTLEHHHGCRLLIRLMSLRVDDRWYLRRVLLSRADTGRPVAMCAARLDLDAADSGAPLLPAHVRATIRAAEVPLGRVLIDNGLHYSSVARAFLEVAPNSEMLGVFWMHEPRRLFGRQTEMILRGTKLGDIIEVLAPL
jgi:hypothetical protein